VLITCIHPGHVGTDIAWLGDRNDLNPSADVVADLFQAAVRLGKGIREHMHGTQSLVRCSADTRPIAYIGLAETVEEASKMNPGEHCSEYFLAIVVVRALLLQLSSLHFLCTFLFLQLFSKDK